MAKLNTSSFLTGNYEEIGPAGSAKSNPIKPNFKPGALHLNSFCFSPFFAGTSLAFLYTLLVILIKCIIINTLHYPILIGTLYIGLLYGSVI